MATIRIGTSGWSYPHWRGPFYPRALRQSDWLAYYAQHFSTVEINTTFYRLPSAQAVTAWRESTPADFVFAPKLSCFVSHMKKLKDPTESLSPFIDRIAGLGPKLGPVLAQLPPNWSCNATRLSGLLDAVPHDWRLAVEFRNQSWWTEDVFDRLRSAGAAVCIFHLARRWSPVVTTASFAYMRLHGPQRAYSGGYRTTTLRRIARRCRDWRDRGLDVYCYFDNDAEGHAPCDAQNLQRLVNGQS